MRKISGLLLILFATLACSALTPTHTTKIIEPTVVGGHLIHPGEAYVNLSDTTLTNFSPPANQSILLRYFAGNGRWEVRQEHGVIYAIRLEKINEKYQTSLNGYYSQHNEYGLVSQTRVLVSFEKPYGFGNLDERITHPDAGNNNVELIISDSFPGTPGYASYLIVDGDGIFVEIYDQTLQFERSFTQKAYNEVSHELSAVLEHLQEIKDTGIMPVTEYYPGAFSQSAYLNIMDGIQPGIYVLDAAVNPTAPGILFVKVFDTSSGEQLSADRITPKSTRLAAWSENGITYFPYQSEITIYEGDWSSEYEARFELWHKDKTGHETKLIEAARLVNGWQR